jgi:LEA14-like dessication related protein
MKTIHYIVCALLILTAACHAPKDLVYKGVNNFSIESANLRAPRLGLNMLFYNPNNRSMTIKHADVEVFINNNHLGNVVLDTRYRIPANDSFSIPVSLTIDMKQVIPDALQIALNKSAEIKLVGHVKAKRGLIYLNIPVNYTGKQPLNLFD